MRKSLLRAGNRTTVTQLPAYGYEVNNFVVQPARRLIFHRDYEQKDCTKYHEVVVKVKITLEQATKTQWGSRVIAQLFL